MKNEKCSKFVLFLNQKTNYTFGTRIGFTFQFKVKLSLKFNFKLRIWFKFNFKFNFKCDFKLIVVFIMVISNKINGPPCTFRIGLNINSLLMLNINILKIVSKLLFFDPIMSIQ